MTTNNTPCAGIALGAVLRGLPDHRRSAHLLQQVEYAYRFGYANPLWTKREAAQLAFAAATEYATARGKGYKAAKRVAIAGEHVAASVRAINRQIAQKRAQRGYDELAEYGCEGRQFYRRRINPHE